MVEKDEDLRDDANKVARAFMGMKSNTMFKTFENTEVQKVFEKMAMGKLEDVKDPSEMMWTMAMAQIDTCIMQLQSVKELLTHYKNKPPHP